MLIEWMKPDFTFENESGCLKQLVREGYKQVNVITSAAGSVRGGHYHKQNEEAFYVISGALEVTVNGDSRRFAAGEFFGIKAYDMHSFTFLEDTVLVSMYSNGVELEDGTKDIFTE